MAWCSGNRKPVLGGSAPTDKHFRDEELLAGKGQLRLQLLEAWGGLSLHLRPPVQALGIPRGLREFLGGRSRGGASGQGCTTGQNREES